MEKKLAIPRIDFADGDNVKITPNAPMLYKPSSIGTVCGIRPIHDEKTYSETNQAIGSKLYLIEFCNGEPIEIPGTYLMEI